MVDITRTILRSALSLEEAAEALGELVEDTDRLRAKHDALSKRIVDRVKACEGALAPAERTQLSSLSTRLAVQGRSLDRQRDQFRAVKAAFSAQHGAFAQLAQKYSERLAALGRYDALGARRELALCRVLESMIYELWAADGTIDADSGFAMPATSHSYIAIAIPTLMNLLMQTDALLRLDPDHALRSGGYRPVRFLEVGCGQGRNLLIARYAKLLEIASLAGFDLNAELVEKGKAHLGLGDEIYVADALEVDYGGHEVVFSYRPIFDAELLAKLEARIARTMDKGAYLIAPHALDFDRYPELERQGADLEIWKKTRESG